jgi:hypothetical protein
VTLERRDVDELLRAIIDALETGDLEHVATLLATEGRVFLDGYERVAAEMGYAPPPSRATRHHSGAARHPGRPGRRAGAVTGSRRQLHWRIAVCESDIDLTAKYVALVLDTFMDKRGFAWPSQETLAARSGVDARTVRRVMTRLEQAGFLIVVHSRGRHSNRYQAIHPNAVTPDRVAADPTRTHESPQPRHACPSNPDTRVLQKPSRKPSRKPNPPGGHAAQQLVAFYIESCRELGAEPPRRVIGQVAQQVGQLVSEGYDEQTIQGALRLMLTKRQHPSTLASFVIEAQAGPPPPRNSARPEHAADAALRRAGIDASQMLEGERQ